MLPYKTLLENALKLKPVDKAHLIEGLITSLEEPDRKIELIWKKEAIKRYKAYKEKRVNARNIEDVLKKYE